MCNPAMASLGTQAAGVGMSTVGAFYSAKAEKSALRSQARMLEINAKIADENARGEVEKGNFNQSQIKLAGSQMKSAQIARLAASGIDIAGSPSAQAALASTDLITEVDSNRARANAVRSAWGQRIEAGNMRRGATSANASASSISPAMAGFSTLLSGAGKVASSWYALDKQGGFSQDPIGKGAVSMDSERGYGRNMVVPRLPAGAPGGRSAPIYQDEAYTSSLLKWAF